MKDVLDYSIPVIHPMAVHFPVALMPLAAIVCIIWVRRTEPAWGLVSRLVLFLSSVACVVAFLSGDGVYDQSEGVPIVEQFVSLHRLLGKLSMILVLVALLSSVGELIARRREQPDLALWLRLLCLGLSVIGALLVLGTGHIGGIMVWGEYVGS